MKNATKIPRRILADIESGVLRLTDILIYFGATRFSGVTQQGQFYCWIANSVGVDYRTIQTRLKVLEKLGYVTISKGAMIRFDTPDGTFSAQSTNIRRVVTKESFRFVPNKFFEIIGSSLFSKFEKALMLYFLVLEFDDNTRGRKKPSKYRPSLDELRKMTRLHYAELKAAVQSMVQKRWIVKDGNGYVSHSAGTDATFCYLDSLNEPAVEQVPPKLETATSSTSDYEEILLEQIRRNREREAKDLRAAIVIPRRVLEVAE